MPVSRLYLQAWDALRENLGDRPSGVDEADCFIGWLRKNLAPVTDHERLGLLAATWE